MNDDELNSSVQGNNASDDSATNAEELTGTKYASGLYNDNPNKDYIDSTNDLNNIDAPLDAGTGDDATFDYDEDDNTLPAENDTDETETGMDDEDFDNVSPLQQNKGDEVVDPEVAA